MTEISGHVATGFEPVADAFEQNFADGLELGAGFSAWIENECVVDLTGGWADHKKTRQWDARTIVPVYSTTKPIGAMMVCRAIYDALGPDAYDTPVSKVWPEFAANGKEAITIGQLMSHQAGLVGFPEPIDPGMWLDPPALAAALAELAPQWTPGDGSGYHPTTWGYLIGELVNRVSERSIGQMLLQDVTNADGHDPDREVIDFWIGTPESEHDRCAEIQRPTEPPALGEINEHRRTAFLTKWASPNRGGAAWRTIEIPSANGHGTARAVARLYAAFANRGQIGDNQLFPHDGQFQALTRRRTLGEDRVLPYAMEFAAGVMRNNNKIYGPNPNTLGHAGWGGSFGLGDPDRTLSAAYVMNKQSNQLQTDQRAQNLIAALYGCL